MDNLRQQPPLQSLISPPLPPTASHSQNWGAELAAREGRGLRQAGGRQATGAALQADGEALERRVGKEVGTGHAQKRDLLDNVRWKQGLGRLLPRLERAPLSVGRTACRHSRHGRGRRLDRRRAAQAASSAQGSCRACSKGSSCRSRPGVVGRGRGCLWCAEQSREGKRRRGWVGEVLARLRSGDIGGVWGRWWWAWWRAQGRGTVRGVICRAPVGATDGADRAAQTSKISNRLRLMAHHSAAAGRQAELVPKQSAWCAWIKRRT